MQVTIAADTTADVLVKWHLGDVVRKLRDERGWSRAVFAKRAKLGIATVARLELGETEETHQAGTLSKIAEAFDTSESELHDAVPPEAGLTFQQRKVLASLPARLTEADYRRVMAAIGSAVRSPQPGAGSSRARTTDPRRPAAGSR